MSVPITERCSSRRSELGELYEALGQLLHMVTKVEIPSDHPRVAQVLGAQATKVREDLESIWSLTWAERTGPVHVVFRSLFETVVDILYISSEDQVQRYQRVSELSLYLAVKEQEIKALYEEMIIEAADRGPKNPSAAPPESFKAAAISLREELAPLSVPPPTDKSSWTIWQHHFAAVEEMGRKYRRTWSGTTLRERVDMIDALPEADKEILHVGRRVFFDVASGFVHGSSALYHMGETWVDELGQLRQGEHKRGILGDFHWTPLILAPRFVLISLRRLDALAGGGNAGSVRRGEDLRRRIVELVYKKDDQAVRFLEGL